jgi:hypothetical protein
MRVFQNRALRRIFGPTRRRRPPNVELHNNYASPNVVKVTNSRRMRWTAHAACMEEMRNAYNILVGKPKGESTRKT